MRPMNGRDVQNAARAGDTALKMFALRTKIVRGKGTHRRSRDCCAPPAGPLILDQLSARPSRYTPSPRSSVLQPAMSSFWRPQLEHTPNGICLSLQELTATVPAAMLGPSPGIHGVRANPTNAAPPEWCQGEPGRPLKAKEKWHSAPRGHGHACSLGSCHPKHEQLREDERLYQNTLFNGYIHSFKS